MQAPTPTVLRGPRHSPAFVVALLGLALLSPAYASAQAQSFPHGTVRLVAESSTIQVAHDFSVALHFSLEDGWHTYWVNPGDSGEAPRVTWTLPPGVTARPIQWPAPEHLGSASVVDYGYKNEVTLLVPMHASANVLAQTPLVLNASVRVLVCKDICVPGKVQVSLALPVTARPLATDQAERSLFTTARARLPRAAPANWKFTATEEKDSFVLSAQVGKRIDQAYFYPLEESQIQNSAQQPVMPGADGFSLRLRKSDQLTKPIVRLKGVLLLSDRAYTVDAAVVRSSGQGGT
jgi:DsbC/DsbD-like thiol-disulfide interchange protein